MYYTTKINVNERRRFDPPRVIFKFRSQAHMLIHNCERTNEILAKKILRYLHCTCIISEGLNNLDFFLVSIS